MTRSSRAVLELIAAGDIYQANLTFRATCRVAGDPLALYARLRGRARGGLWRRWSRPASDWLLSLLARTVLRAATAASSPRGR